MARTDELGNGDATVEEILERDALQVLVNHVGETLPEEGGGAACAPAAVVLGIEALHGRFVRFDDGKNLSDGECCGISHSPRPAWSRRDAGRSASAGAICSR